MCEKILIQIHRHVSMVQPVVHIPLNDDWQIVHKEKDINLSCTIPETVFESLIKNGIIPDPFYGLEEHNVSWVYESDWIYEKWFDVEPKLLSYPKLILRFHGLDTISEVFLNGKSLGKTENMFRVYDFDIKPIAKLSDNHLEVRFSSPTKYARTMKTQFKDNLNTGRKTAIPGIPYLRKAQYSFGWDWGPKLPDVGIWKPIEIICSDNLSIQAVLPRLYYFYDKEDNTIDGTYPKIKLVKLETDISLKNEHSYLHILQLRVISPSGREFIKNIVTQKSEETIELLIEEPDLWWTHDLGKPSLHSLEVIIAEKNTIIDAKSLTIGLRDIQLVRDQDVWGETFYFRLNGLPVFAKGGNWIPIDSFISRGKKLKLYQMNLQFAKEANFNFIRIWGGGIYEDDDFYDLCDQMGILVWNDFPFACAVYPLHDNHFLENIIEEVIQNIVRLRHHASLALWVGNNEVEWLFDGLLLISGTTLKKKKYKNHYIQFFELTLPQIVNQYDSQRDYWPSSPSNGGYTSEMGGGIIRSKINHYGDSHYWGVWHGGRSFLSYRKQFSRFMSEFGFESFPDLQTILKFCPIEQLDMFSPIMENHQKNSAGNKKILDYMKKRFSIPQDFAKQVILSQITQAEAMKYGVEHWRRNRNEYRCMGTLYWQLNDCWPVASWSSIDYYGRWKALHYFAKRFYAPLLPIILDLDDCIEFWIVNDTNSDKNVSLSYAVWDSEGIIVARNENLTGENHSVPALTSQLVVVQEIKKKIKGKYQQVIFARVTDENNQIFENFHLLGQPSDFLLQKPKLEMKLQEDSLKKGCQVQVSTDQITPYVFLESDLFDLIFSDNYFSMEPHSEKTISVRLNPFIHKNTKVTEKEIFLSLKIRSLWDLRNEK